MANRKLRNEELGRKSIKEFKATQKMPVVLVLDNIRSLNNVGSVFRTADAFAVEKIILCGITARPPHREIQKTALGATESVNWEFYKLTEEAIRGLKEDGFTIISIEQAEKACKLSGFKFSKEKKYALVFGHEVKGVDQSIIDLSDQVIEIPQEGTKHSLNIAVSVGVVCWEISRQF